jgi:hypothetical protein
LLLVQNLRVERDTDADSGVVLHPDGLVVRFHLPVLAAVGFPLDDEPAVASGDELLKNIGKFLRDLPESALNCFVLGLV